MSAHEPLEIIGLKFSSFSCVHVISLYKAPPLTPHHSISWHLQEINPHQDIYQTCFTTVKSLSIVQMLGNCKEYYSLRNPVSQQITNRLLTAYHLEILSRINVKNKTADMLRLLLNVKFPWYNYVESSYYNNLTKTFLQRSLKQQSVFKWL